MENVNILFCRISEVIGTKTKIIIGDSRKMIEVEDNNIDAEYTPQFLKALHSIVSWL
jgi:hypothetical protein